ncbi:MAG: hypothetical protein IT342_26775, partial [Candidatus Melainabacteria bacterium]|nr:hypothetical protein [Candidatus Melainabacteria bacterium]
MSRNKHVLRYHVLPVWLFSFFLTISLLSAAAAIQTAPLDLARKTVDVIKHGLEKGL